MTTHPLDTTIASLLNSDHVPKADLVSFLKSRMRVRAGSASEVVNADYSGVFGLDLNGRLFDRDLTDTTTAADFNTLVDNVGTRFKAVASLGAFGASAFNGKLVASVAANALNVAIKTLAGKDPSASDPVYVPFRNVTAANGDCTVVTITSATSLLVSSGSTLGAHDSNAFRLWVVGLNDAGTFRLGVTNCVSFADGAGATIAALHEGALRSSTAEGGAGAADNAGVIYTGAAVSSKAFRILGYMDWGSGLATAGTWASGPTKIQLFGPGIPRPGQVIQSGSMTTSTETNTSSTSPVVTTLTKDITLTETPNLVKVSAIAGLQSINGAASANARMFRNGAVQIGNSIQMYPNNFYGSGLTMMALDKPNSAAALTYAAYVWASAPFGVDFLPDGVGGQVGHLLLEEIMG